MRKLLASALTCVIVPLATLFAAPQNIPIPRESEVSAPPAHTAKIDPSKVKFLLRISCSAGWLAGAQGVNGIVASGIDLSDDLTARQLLEMGFASGQEKCPSAEHLYVYLRPGDPASFTSATKGFEFVSGSLYGYPADVVGGGWSKGKSAVISGYQNFPRALKDQQLAEAAQARQREAVLAQQRQAAQRVQSEIAARSAAFVKANGVAHFVTVDRLAANPFVYQDQVVAIYGAFEQMNSATQGLFSIRDKRFVVSGIPAAKFTQQGSLVMLAGRVLGNIEIKLPVLGPTLVPNLSFVGSAFCQQQGCSDYAINLR